jgi:hypothetical protein
MQFRHRWFPRVIGAVLSNNEEGWGWTCGPFGLFSHYPTGHFWLKAFGKQIFRLRRKGI